MGPIRQKSEHVPGNHFRPGSENTGNGDPGCSRFIGSGPSHASVSGSRIHDRSVLRNESPGNLQTCAEDIAEKLWNGGYFNSEIMGALLGLSYDQIEISRALPSEKKVAKIFELWLNKEPAPSTAKIIEAFKTLKDMKQVHFIKDNQQYFDGILEKLASEKEKTPKAAHSTCKARSKSSHRQHPYTRPSHSLSPSGQNSTSSDGFVADAAVVFARTLRIDRYLLHTDWFSLGTMLGARTEHLQSIRQDSNCSMSLDLPVLRMLNAWLLQDKNPSWEKVRDALVDIGDIKAARLIEKNLIGKTTPASTKNRLSDEPCSQGNTATNTIVNPSCSHDEELALSLSFYHDNPTGSVRVRASDSEVEDDISDFPEQILYGGSDATLRNLLAGYKFEFDRSRISSFGRKLGLESSSISSILQTNQFMSDQHIYIMLFNEAERKELMTKENLISAFNHIGRKDIADQIRKIP